MRWREGCCCLDNWSMDDVRMPESAWKGVEPLSQMLRGLVETIFAWYGGGRGHFIPARRRDDASARSALVLSPGELPTTDIYLRLPLATRFGQSVRYVDASAVSPSQLEVPPGTLVIIVRHIPTCWLRWLAERRDGLAGVVYLLDDDIPAALSARELPFFYALKSAWRYANARRRLQEVCDQVWVSTEELAHRCAPSCPRVFEPTYVPAEKVAEATDDVVYFYHGTWAHRREIEWLVPIVRAVQEHVPDAWFEIIGTTRVRWLFRGIPRVRVIPPMSWPSYLGYAGTVRYRVGLAPCFDTPFNRARAHVKLFDITRLGAAGIYSDVVPYRGKIASGETGWLCENSQAAWIAAICKLLAEPGRCAQLHSNALAYCFATRDARPPRELSR